MRPPSLSHRIRSESAGLGVRLVALAVCFIASNAPVAWLGRAPLYHRSCLPFTAEMFHPRGRNRAMADNRTASLREGDQENDQHDRGHYGEKPEYRPPAKPPSEETSHQRAESWAKQDASGSIADIAAPFPPSLLRPPPHR